MRHRLKIRHFLPLLGLLGFLCLPAHAINIGQETRFEHDFDEEIVAWQEVQAQLPAIPVDVNLLSFGLDGRPDYRYAVDRKSLSVGADGVTRYSIVIISPSGARTLNFEGMRCATGERKIYAFGRPDGSWSKNRAARWDPIQARQAASYHSALFYEYLCAGGEGTASVEQIVQRLKRGGYRVD